jgi:hypothetical protein
MRSRRHIYATLVIRLCHATFSRLAEIDPEESLRAAYCHRVIRHTVLWMESKIEKEKKLIDGEPIGMSPGTCSNPEPPASIKECRSAR